MKRSLKRFGKATFLGVALAGAICIAPVASADEFRIESRQGPVEQIDASGNHIVVAGVGYDVAVDANVEVAGSYGALSMVSPGMNVEVLVRRYLDTGDAQVIDLKELPRGVVPEQY